MSSPPDQKIAATAGDSLSSRPSQFGHVPDARRGASDCLTCVDETSGLHMTTLNRNWKSRRVPKLDQWLRVFSDAEA